MARALLIAGDEERFFRNLLPMRLFLAHAGQPCDVTVLKAGEMPPTELCFRMATWTIRQPDEPALLVYSGHGLPGGWTPTPEYVFTYQAVAVTLALRRSPTVLINSCCYPAAVFSELEKAGASRDLVSVIAAGPEDKVTYDGLISRVVDSWERQEAYRPFVGIYPELRHPAEEHEDLSAFGRLILGSRRLMHRFFNAVEPWQDLDERRWGAVHDRHFFRSG